MTSHQNRYLSSPPPIRVSVPNPTVRAEPADEEDDLCLSPGYKSYSRKLLLQLPTEYDTASHDDLSSDETYDISASSSKSSNWRKVRNVVQWTPFIQTYKRYKYPWVQLAGHQGNFKAGYKQGTIMKKLCPAEEKAFEALLKDVLQPYVPEYLGIVEGADGDKYLQLQDLLSDFNSPCVMDIKMGVRTYLEEELAKARHRPKLRKDMYEKMVQIDPRAPTDAESRAKAVTKPRYMVWRETISSTATLGFRIEGVRMGDGSSSKDFKTTKTRDQVMTALKSFIEGYNDAVVNYIERLKQIRTALEKSTFFRTHELIGSSLLFVHNEKKSGVWLIDFAKTIPLPNPVKISHNVPWVEGTHEDGYLIGLDNLIDLLSCLHKDLSSSPASRSTNQNSIISTKSDDILQESVSTTTADSTNSTKCTPNSLPETIPSSPVKNDTSTNDQRPLSKCISSPPPSSISGLTPLKSRNAPPSKLSSQNCNVTDVIERKTFTSDNTEKKAN